MKSLSRTVAVSFCLLAIASVSASAAEVFVNNRQGNDAFDGHAGEIISATRGPVRSISRGLSLCQPGDILHLANTGVPYREPISLSGDQFRGIGPLRFVLRGHGAVLDGSQAIPLGRWRRINPSLWQFAPNRKGYYLLMAGGDTQLERIETPYGEQPKPQPNQWTVSNGSIFLGTDRLIEPAMLDLRIAGRTTGLTLHDVDSVVIEDLTIRHWRVDGISLHDLSRNVTLQNVTCEENGRAGIFVGGSSSASLQNVTANKNGKYSILVRERGVIRIDNEDNISPQPVVEE